MLVVSATLVLRSGERIDIVGPLQESGGQVIFRASDGALYSLPVAEIDDKATVALDEARRRAEPPAPRKLKVTAAERDRLLAELSMNRNGQEPLPQRILTDPRPAAAAPAPSGDEWSWRRQARFHEENIRRAEENLGLLQSRIDELENEIGSLLSLGYKPRQFSYETTVLVRSREAIPAAELAVTQARRAYDQFREDARRQGVLPGWLR